MANKSKKSNVIRKNIRMSPAIAEWYEKKAESLGVSQSNLMVMALAEYMKQDKTLNAMSNFENIIKQMKYSEEQ